MALFPLYTMQFHIANAHKKKKHHTFLYQTIMQNTIRLFNTSTISSVEKQSELNQIIERRLITNKLLEYLQHLDKKKGLALLRQNQPFLASNVYLS